MARLFPGAPAIGWAASGVGLGLAAGEEASAPRASAQPPTAIKCSDCGHSVDLMQLGEHVCNFAGTSLNKAALQSSLLSSRRMPPLSNDLTRSAAQDESMHDESRLRSKAAGLRILTAPAPEGDSLHGPRMESLPHSPVNTAYPQARQHLSPRPTMERSFSNGSCNSQEGSTSPGGRSLPFFDKYNKMYGSNLSPSPSSASSFAPRSPSLTGSQPLSASQSHFTTPSTSQSSLQEKPHSHQRRLSDEDTDYGLSPELDSIVHEPEEYETPRAPLRPNGSHRQQAQQQFIHYGRDRAATDLTKYYQPSGSAAQPAQISKYDYKMSKSDPAHISRQARPADPRMPPSPLTNNSLAQLDNLLDDFDLDHDADARSNAFDFEQTSSRPRQGSASSSGSQGSDRHAAGFAYLMSGKAPSPPSSFGSQSSLDRAYSTPKMQQAPSSGSYFTKSQPMRGPVGASNLQKGLPSAPRTMRCDHCKLNVHRDELQMTASQDQYGDDAAVCNRCYAQLYLPKCRKCSDPIQGKATGSGDGKIKGKFHPECFTCFTCSAPFPNRDCFVFNGEPYCERHYHRLAGSNCVKCQRGIEGPCVSLSSSESRRQKAPRRYHVDCFSCSARRCPVLLTESHYIVHDLPYCEEHALEQSGASYGQKSQKPERRQTLIQPFNSRQRYF